MARRWTEHQPRKGNILDAEGVNAAYDAYKGWINGGIDRTSVSESTISGEQLLDYAVLQVTTSNNKELPTAYQNSTGGDGGFICLEYGVYSGGWQSGSSFSLTGLREGMLHVEWSCWCYHYPDQTLFNPKGSRWQLTWNGNPIASTHIIGNHWNNPYIVADIPITGGSGTLAVLWAYKGPDPTYDLNLNDQFMYGGGNIFIQAVWR